MRIANRFASVAVNANCQYGSPNRRLNSSATRANPDPTATVRYGKLTTDEMFHGYFDAALVPQPRLPPNQLTLLTALVATLGCWVTRRRWTKH